MPGRHLRLLLMSVILAVGAGTGLAYAAGAFSSPARYPEIPHSMPSQVAIGRLNADKRPDMVVANCAPGSVDKITLRLGTSGGKFGKRRHLPGKGCAEGVVIADLNGDHKQDIAVTSFDRGLASVFLGRGDGTFRPRADYHTGAGAFGIIAEDFTGDGKLDLATTNLGANSVSVLPGRGNGTFRKRRNTQLGGNKGPWGLVSVDMNADDKPDLAVTENGADEVATLVSHGDGTFDPPDVYPTDTGPSGLATALLGPDNRPYLISANDGSTTLSVFRVSHGECVAIGTLPVGDHPQGVAATDVNGDGKIDLVSANLASDDVSVLIGHGDGSTFDPHDDYPAGHAPTSVTAAKLNSDHRPDLAVADSSQSAPGVSVLLARHR